MDPIHSLTLGLSCFGVGLVVGLLIRALAEIGTRLTNRERRY
jgi:hypothetical protein